MGPSKQVIIGVISPLRWGYPKYNLLITLLTKSHEPLSKVQEAQSPKHQTRNSKGHLLVAGPRLSLLLVVWHLLGSRCFRV